MSAIFGPAPTGQCDRCGMQATQHPASGRFVCGLCRKLGDRSLAWYTRRMTAASSDEERQELRDRFAAARGRGWTPADVQRAIQAGWEIPPGVIQWMKEQREGTVPPP